MKKWKIGYTSGTFDLFHEGHKNIIKKAKEQCEYLIVAVSTDELCQEYKHILPYQSVLDRMRVISEIPEVDQVVLQKTMDKVAAYKKYHFDVMFVGDDWKNTKKWNTIQKELVKYDVSVIYIPYTKGISSTLIRNEIEKYGYVYQSESDSYMIGAYRGIDEILTLPSSFRGKKVTSIGKCAFAFCATLKRIQIPDSITVIESEAFYCCTSLEQIDLPHDVCTIGVGAFAECHNLRHIILPPKLKVLESYLFYHCYSLVDVKIPASVIIIRENATKGAEQLLKEKKKLLYWDKWCISCINKEIETLILDDETIGIADAAFTNYHYLNQIQLPKSLIHIGMFAFDGTLLWNSYEDGEVIYADHWAIGIAGDLYKVETIILSHHILGIGDLAFGGCLQLKHIYHKTKDIIIGDRACPILPEYDENK